MPVFPGCQRTQALRKLWEMPEVKKLVRRYGFSHEGFSSPASRHSYLILLAATKPKTNTRTATATTK